MVRGLGFGPRLDESKSSILPLDDPRKNSLNVGAVGVEPTYPLLIIQNLVYNIVAIQLILN
jgi:hypothetical protein